MYKNLVKYINSIEFTLGWVTKIFKIFHEEKVILYFWQIKKKCLELNEVIFTAKIVLLSVFDIFPLPNTGFSHFWPYFVQKSDMIEKYYVYRYIE